MRPSAVALVPSTILFHLACCTSTSTAFHTPTIRQDLGVSGWRKAASAGICARGNGSKSSSLHPRISRPSGARARLAWSLGDPAKWSQARGNRSSAVTGSTDGDRSKSDEDLNADRSANLSEKPPKRVGKVEAAADKLRSYGLAGLLAYGVMNQIYYSTAFAMLWLGPMGAVATAAPAAAGFAAWMAVSSKQLAKVMAVVWVGSQATKPLRYLLAILLAPAADILLTSTQQRLRLPTRQRAFFLLCAALLSTTASFCTGTVVYATLRAATSQTTQASSSVILLAHGGLCRRLRSSSFSRDSRLNELEKVATSTQRTGLLQEISEASRRGYGWRVPTRKTAEIGVAAESTGAPSSDNKRRSSLGLGHTREVDSERQLNDGPNDDADRVPQRSRTTGQTATATATARVGAKGSGAGIIRKRRTKRITPQKAADLNPPPQDNIHGWQEQPKHLLGFWKVGAAVALPDQTENAAPEAIAAAAPAVAAAAALAAATAAATTAYPEIPSTVGPPSPPVKASVLEEVYALEADGGFGNRETAEMEGLDLGSDILHHIQYVVLKRDGSLKAGPARLGVVPRAWRFTPANRRLLFEVDVPGRGVTLRYSAKLKRVPGQYTMAKGLVRVRQMSDTIGETELPSSSRKWPKLAEFEMTMQLKKKFRHHEKEE